MSSVQSMHKIQLLLFKDARAGSTALLDALRTAARAITIRHAAVELATALPAGVMGASTQGESGGALPSIDAVLEISAPPNVALPTLAQGLTGIGARLKGLIDPVNSCALAGTEHIVMPGTGPVILFCPLRRLSSLSRGEFQDYWLNKHADYGRFPGNRYRQYHCDESATALTAASVGLPAGDFDGLAIAFFDDVDHLRRVLASPDISKDAFADEQRFIDHARSQFRPFSAVDLAAG